VQLAVNARILNDRFQLVRVVGEGGMGVVWEACEIATGKRCALKFVRNEAWTPVLTRRLLREAKAAQAVRHPNVVTISEVIIADDGEPVVVMELLSGESLAQCLVRKGALPLPLAAGILARVIEGVRAAHAVGVVHRDLKPENIFLVDQSDGTFDIRILDFGIAKRLGGEHDLSKTENLTVTGTVMGTPYYMSPEQAFGEKNVDSQTDVWALGVIAFECLTARLPVEGENIGQIMKVLFSGDLVKLAVAAPHLPEDVLAAVDRALLIARDARAPNVDELGGVMRRHAAASLAITLLDRASAARVAVGVTSPSERPDALGSTQLASVRPPPQQAASGVTAGTASGPGSSGAWSRWLVAAFALVVLGLPGAWLATRTRHVASSVEPPSRGATNTDQPPPRAVSQPGVAATTPSSSSSVTLAPTETAAVSVVASSPPPALASAKKPGAHPSPSAAKAPPKAPAAPSAIKLQGGVAGETPF
jgi:serine/threonine-protein kinase